MVYSYAAFGLCLKSEIMLPEFMEGDGECDVSIRFGRADLGGEAKATGSFFKATEDEIQFTFKDTAVITVRQGREIIVDLLPNASEASLRFSIINATMAAVLQHRGLLVFHASAVARDGRAAIFMGSPTSGKSTIAAAMHRSGFSVLSDEIVAVAFPTLPQGDGPVVLPGMPHIRLLPRSAQYLGQDPESMPRIRSDEDKRAYSARNGFPENSIPLRRIYILKKSDGNCLEPIAPQAAFLEIISNYYTIGMVRAGGAPEHLKNCTRLISTVPIRRLHRADALHHLPGLIELVGRDLENDSLQP
jgi:hypothetical protein